MESNRPAPEPHVTATLACHPRLGPMGERFALVPGGSTPVGPPEALLEHWRARGPGLVRLGERLAVWLETEPSSIPPPSPPGMVGSSPPMRRLYLDIERARARPESVLIRGETGSGKELVARALHREGPFIALNLAAVPASLAASELFGHRAGSFTGAAEHRPGVFARSAGGTLFLDEVGEIGLDVQAMLLRAVEEQSILPLGADRPEPTRLRLITATDADLMGLVRQGRFRKALYYRLAAVEMSVPPLRARGADILRLMIAELKREVPAERSIEWLTPELLGRLLAHPWPGNVRELRNWVRRMLMLDGAPRSELERAIEDSLGPPEPASAPVLAPGSLTELLEAHAYKVHAAAAAAGISRATLYRRIRAHPELRVAKDIGKPELRRHLEHAGGDVASTARALRVSVGALRMRMRSAGLL